MPEPIDPPGINWSRVSAKLVPVRLITEFGATVVLLALVSVPLALMLAGAWPRFPAWLAWLLPVAALIVRLWRMALVPRQVAAIGYAERDEDLLLRGGIFFQRVLVVPYGRMQYVDVAVGPLERAFGLSSVKLHTAAAHTNARIVGLPAPEAARLRERLSARGEARLAGL